MAEKNVSAPSRAENARYVVEQLRLLGVTPAPDSRIMIMHDLMQGKTEYGDPNYYVALEADRDLVQLGFIFEQLEAHREDAKFQQLVKDLVRDSTLPQIDRTTNSPGRDGQFELYLAAVCQKAGMTPVGYHEPDVTCHVDGTMMGIAAKRVKNQKHARKRITEAIDQIHRDGRPGIVALEMSIAWNRDNEAIPSPLHKLRHDHEADKRVGKFFARHESAIVALSAGHGVLGVVAFQFIPYIVADRGWRQQRAAWWLEIGNNEDPNRLYHRFSQRFIDVIPNLDTLPIAK